MNSHFGIYGGQYIAETLMPTLIELEREYLKAKEDPEFRREMQYLLADYVGRESPLYYAKRLSDYAGGAKIYLKREDLNHTGRAQDQQHHRAGAAGAADGQDPADRGDRRGDARRRHRDRRGAVRDGVRRVHGRGRRRAAGAECGAHENAGRAGDSGHNRFGDAEGCDERGDPQLGRDFRKHLLCDRTVAGPHPYPAMVKEFQSVIGIESRRQILAKTGKLPKEVLACVGGGSNAIGMVRRISR